MTLALIFRKFAHWTTGYCFENACVSMGLDFRHVDNNQVFGGHVSLAQFDRAIVIDDGFGVQALGGLPKRSAFYCIDAHNGFEKHYAPYLGQFGKVYCANKTLGVDLLKANGFESTWLPLAYDPIGFPPTQHPRAQFDYPVSIIASWSTQQRIDMRRLVVEKYGGYNSPEGGIFRGELANVIGRSCIGWNAFGLQVDQKMRKDHVNMRTFEIAGCGAMLLQPHADVPDMEELGFQGGVHLAYWDGDTLESLFEMTDYYLAHPETREEIARVGQEFVLANHTYTHRVQHMLDLL